MKATRFHPKAWIEGESPLTDPRSVGISLLLHSLLVLVASAAALSVSGPVETATRPKALRAELEPVDNKARDLPETEGGGSAGDAGSNQVLPNLDPKPREGEDAPTAARDPAADALLAEILPAPPSPETLRQSLPGPETSSLTLVPGLGAGGGGGSGGGAGGGAGRGNGPGTEFFGAREHATSFAYVIDCSGSMATRGSLDMAKRELANSLNQLPPDAQFAVIFYNLQATMFSDPRGRRGLMPATQANKARVGTQLTAVSPDGGTDHMAALRAALALRPEVIFFLTDADLMTHTDVSLLLSEAGGTRIQAVEFGRGVELGVGANPLRKLAAATGGHYRYIDVTRFPAPR